MRAEKELNKPDAETFGRSLPKGLGVNLLVTSISRMVAFCEDVLDARIEYWDDDFAIVRAQGSVWMLHHDRTYRHHPMSASVADQEFRGGGIELRLYGLDPANTVRRARKLGYEVLEEALEKPHGVTEAFILGPDGYIWVPTQPKG